MVYLEKDPKFYQRLMTLSESVGIPPEDLLVVMTLESGINPTIHNNNYGGLTQMSNNTLKGLGYSGNVEDFSKEPAYKQLDFIEKQINKLKGWIGGNFETVEQYYLGNLLPISLKLNGVRNKDVNTIIVSKDPKEPHLPGVSLEMEKTYYNSNKGLDLDRDGSITYGDIQNFLNKKRNESHYKHAMDQMKVVMNYEPKIESNVVNTKNNENKLFNIIDNLLEKISSKSLKKKDNLIIKINSSDCDISTEISRLISMALKENLNINSLLYKDDNNLEIVSNLNFSNIKKALVIDTINNVCLDFNKIINKKGFDYKIKINKDQTINKPLFYKDAINSYRRVITKLNYQDVL